MDDLKGKYCLTYLQASIPENMPKLQHLYDLMHSHGAFVSEFDDPGHRVPRFSMLNWAACVPSSCTAMDIQMSLNDYVQNFTKGTDIHVQVRVEPQMCQTNDRRPYDESTIKAAIFFLVVILVATLSTVVDLKVVDPNPWLVAFSLRKNLRATFNLKRAPNDIECIHGIRFFNAFLLMVSHKSMAIFFDPYINRTQLSEALGQPWTVLGRAAAIYTDTFLMFSGLLTSYAIIGRLQKNQSPRILQEYVGRFIRIVPTLGALILFCTFILPHVDTGPQWNLVVTRHAGICKQHWWRNLLFIHNYFGFENMCLTHTHHLGIDTELFVVAPVLILLLWKWPKKGAMILLGLAGISTIARFNVTVVEKLSNYVYFGTSIKRLFKTADYMYSIPFYRSTIYILGILLGYVLRVFKDHKLTKTQLKVGWYVNVTLFLLVLLGPAPMGSISYVYNEYHAALYAALGPMAWCGLAGWIIFTSHLGYHSLLSRFFSWPGFLVTTRLSYAIYLTQFPVFFFNVGRTRHATYFSFLSYTLNLNENISIALASIALTIFFDTPFQNIKKIIFNPSEPSSIPSGISVNKSEKLEQISHAKELKFE
ncbi:hypothetical protein HA402_013836 [Bradysia odoriphaga]|nr:hypothetical protein HA402_013836 [Bradysia odoriphaga]